MAVWKIFLVGTVRRCRPEGLTSPINVDTDSGQVRNTVPAGTVADTDVTTRRPVSKVSSHSSHSSLLRKTAMNEVRRTFFTSTSSTSLADSTAKSKASVKDSEEAVQTSESPELTDPASGRLLLILWFCRHLCIRVN